MDTYKFGNTLCRLREEHNLTQKELAQILDVSDKAISKWENGQAIPRMETFEKIASTLGTTVEELISLSRENIKRIRLVNNYSFVTHIEINGTIISLKTEEEKWIELDPDKQTHEMTISGELELPPINDETKPPKTIKEKLIAKGNSVLQNWLSKTIERSMIQTKCTYLLSDIENEETINIELDSFTIGDKMWLLNYNIVISYPKIVSDNCKAKLIKSVCQNKTAVMSEFRKSALTSELGISIPLMLIAYPFRKAYFKNVLKPSSLLKHIEKADYYTQKYGGVEDEKQKKSHPILKGISLVILFIVAVFAIDIVGSIINIESEKPALVSADMSTITFFRDEYVRIDDLPFDALPEKFLGADVFYDARTDGLSRLDQALEGNKVLPLTDRNGNKYLWLIPDYLDNYFDENGEARDYKDFETYYVYAMK